MLRRLSSFIVVAVAVLCLAPSRAAQNSASAPAGEPAMQLPPDQSAFRAANTIVDARQRADALEAFLRDYPKSKRAGNARTILLNLLVEQQPLDARRIHTIAKAKVDAAGKDSRAGAETSVAFTLADARPNGVDLHAAETWARDAAKLDTLETVTARMRAAYKEAKVPQPSEEEIHDDWAEIQGTDLLGVAEVYAREGKYAAATATLDKASAIDPTLGGIYYVRGRIAHAQHQDEEALAAFEQAEVYGANSPETQALLKSLYAARHGGDSAGLEAEIDRRYATLYKPAAPVKHAVPTAGRTVLLEVYTGSECGPCVGADLAMDSVLQDYPRTEVVELALDQHIPDPDPLANEATIARFGYNHLQYTPTIRLDGVQVPDVYGKRERAAQAYQILSTALDKELSVPAGVELALKASVTPEHTVAAQAEFRVTDAAVLGRLLAPKPEETKPDAAKEPAKADSKEAAPAKDPKLVLNFALVQKEVRYSGGNGIRFHPMVVRDLAKPTADGFLVAPAGSSTAAFTFDPAAVSASLSKYLAAYEQHNDRFGVAHFMADQPTLPLDELAVAAWVEDLASHQVVAAAFAPLGGSTAERASR